MQERERGGVATYLNGTNWMPAGGAGAGGQDADECLISLWVLTILKDRNLWA